MFKNISLAAMKLFLIHSSVFYCHVALLYDLPGLRQQTGSKKASIEPKIFCTSAQQTCLNNFIEWISKKEY
ncbi:MAG: hypothetical protein KTR30_03540, partial [Saprospiraceae bacterium]|nr:hypothetical protein [Saprospiraceae bacterium]